MINRNWSGLFILLLALLVAGQAPQAGRVAAGHKLFQKTCSACHGAEAKGGSAGCSRCHIFGAQGGRLGPNLSRISEEKRVSELKKNITQPDANLSDGYRAAEVHTADGSVIHGVIKNEDSFSLQMMDEREQLHLFSKSDLKELSRPQKSLIVLPDTDPTPKGVYVCPDASGATNWVAPSYDPATALFFVSVREGCANYTRESIKPKPGDPFTGGDPQKDHNHGAPGSVRANDPMTSGIRWSFPVRTGSSAAGVLATAGVVVFASDPEGSLLALEPRTGEMLWHYRTGGEIRSSPISYEVDGKQYIAKAGDSTLFAFALP